MKLGQLLATRPDLVPEDYVLEFTKLHDRVLPLPFETIDEVLTRELGSKYKSQIQSVDPDPLGSASIAQVHKARLVSGEEVVLKVQRPKIIETISDDINVLYLSLNFSRNLIPEARLFNPRGIVDSLSKLWP